MSKKLPSGSPVRIGTRLDEVIKPGPNGFRVKGDALVYWWKHEGKTWERVRKAASP